MTDHTDQIQNTGRMRLVFNTLGEKKKALATLAGVSNIVVCNCGFLFSEVGGKCFLFKCLIAKPEELLGEAKAPISSVSLASTRSCLSILSMQITHLIKPGAL